MVRRTSAIGRCASGGQPLPPLPWEVDNLPPRVVFLWLLRTILRTAPNFLPILLALVRFFLRTRLHKAGGSVSKDKGSDGSGRVHSLGQRRMTAVLDFAGSLEAKVAEQLGAQRVGYLLGAGSSYLDSAGYPLSLQLWDLIKDRISDPDKRRDIQAKLDGGATGIEHALDLLDSGCALDTPYRHLVTNAVADLFLPKEPALDWHIEFVRRLSQRAAPYVKVFSLNYDPLMERAAERAHVRLIDGFIGHEHAYFNAAVFSETFLQSRGPRAKATLHPAGLPIHLYKLHGSLGWYEGPSEGVRRCAFGVAPPANTKRLMVPPQWRKATDTMYPPYAALWSAFRGCLSQDAKPLHRLACFGYGFGDEHVNAVIEAALARADFTLLIFAKALSDTSWNRWSVKPNVIVVTEERCSLKGRIGPGHPNLWRFELLSKRV